MTVKTAPHGHGTITAGMPNVFIENTAPTRSQHGTVRFTLIRNLLYILIHHEHALLGVKHYIDLSRYEDKQEGLII